MFVIEPMRIERLDEVLAIERDCFSIPWSRESFQQELADNKIATYVVATTVASPGGKIAGYAGMWHVVTEGHITNIAVGPAFRRQGVGSLLLGHFIALAVEKNMIGLTLEVRVGNEGAITLYHRHGFVVEGIRKNYYADTREDAVIMWKYFTKH